MSGRFSPDFRSYAFSLGDEAALEKVRGIMMKHDQPLADELLVEMRRANDDSYSNVLVVGTDGDLRIVIVHVAEALIGYEEGPVLLPSADPQRVFAAVSRETVVRRANTCLAMSVRAEAEEKWNRMVTWFFDRTLELAYSGKNASVPDDVRTITSRASGDS